MKFFQLNVLLLSLLIRVNGQDFQSQFLEHCQSNDTTKQLEVLIEWEQVSPNNPELFTSYLNYYFSKSRQELLTLTTEEPDGQTLILKDSLNKTAGFIGSRILYNEKELEKGFEWIDRGIELFPNRLDMRFGKIYALGQLKDWGRFTDEIIKTVKYSTKNNNEWTWTNNEKRKNGREFFLSSLQDYQVQLYNTGNNDVLYNMRAIADEILKYYPNHVESLSNKSITYLLTKEYDKAIQSLLRAEKIRPKDAIVLSNIAHGYKMKGDKEMAIAYYEKTIEYGDQRSVEFARQQIEELKK